MLPEAEQATFQGYVRSDGTVGTRNYLGVLTTVNCSATAARQIANRLRYSGILDDYGNVDGVVALTHGWAAAWPRPARASTCCAG